MGNSIGAPIVEGDEYSQVIKYDVMMKRAQGRTNKHILNYRDRLFTLTSKALLYYDGTTLEKRGELKGIVILRNIAKIEPVKEVVLKKQNCFVIEHVGLSLFIVANNVKQRDSWIEAISSRLEDLYPLPAGEIAICPISPRKENENKESKSSHIWRRKYESFDQLHPESKNRTIFERFNLSCSLSEYTDNIKYVHVGTDLVRLELKAVTRIFAYLTVRDIANLRCVCKRWKDLTEIGDLWSEVSAVKTSFTNVKNMCEIFGSHINKLELKSISGDITSSVFNASLLTHLRLEYTQVNLSVLPKFMLNLTFLKICSCVLPHLGSLKIEFKFEKLKSLIFNFRDNYEQTQIINVLGFCPAIEKLDISGYAVLNSTVFKENPFIEELKMEYVKFDASLLTQYCPNLKKLSLVWSDFVGPKKGTFQRLSTLYITYQNTCVYETLLRMFRSAPQLKVLSLTGLLDMTVSMFNKLVPYFQSVTTLIIKRCTLLNNDCMVQIGNYCHELEELDISDLGDISGDGIIALLVSTGNLKCLDLSCTKADDKVFQLLVKRIVKLEKLGISACPFIQDESMRILSKITTLKHLDIKVKIIKSSRHVINCVMAGSTDAMEAEEYYNSPSVFQTDRRVRDYYREDMMLRFRIKLIKINRLMTKTNAYYLHQQMKRYFPFLTKEIQEPHYLFKLLIDHGFMSSEDTTVLTNAFFAMKRHDLVSILTEEPEMSVIRKQRSHSSVSLREVHNEPLRPLTDQFIYTFCREEIGPNDLLGLGVNGFRIPLAAIQRAKYDANNILDATIAVFTYWKQQAPLSDLSDLPTDSMPPYTMEGLAKALKDAQLNYPLRKYF
ncbi:Tyrosine-protein kinase TXK-like [Oopsacas minuta]|uniref:Tyrosine-protein kinase TXK-like n=1 Tax=Oopsacas minuta TaxID=111878 RepID=A0AAV7KKF2_9METZ|nr:Tyrosine-protein kinase TXK-like [Oopsacas minuta]